MEIILRCLSHNYFVVDNTEIDGKNILQNNQFIPIVFIF